MSSKEEREWQQAFGALREQLIVVGSSLSRMSQWDYLSGVVDKIEDEFYRLQAEVARLEEELKDMADGLDGG